MFDELAGFSVEVRQSSLKRLNIVEPGMENWKPLPEMLSFADIAFHLIEADKWFFRKMTEKDLALMTARPGSVFIENRDQYSELLKQLSNTGVKREQLIRNTPVSNWEELIYDGRYQREVSLWWILVRGNLDHEIHHRGQLSVYLRLACANSAR